MLAFPLEAESVSLSVLGEWVLVYFWRLLLPLCESTEAIVDRLFMLLCGEKEAAELQHSSDDI